MSAEQALARRSFAAINNGDERAGTGCDTDDAALVARAVTDRAAFGRIYDRYAERIYRYCYRRLGDREAAEDATSQVFVKALVALPGYREGGTFAGWLFAIAFSTTADMQRRWRPTVPIDDAYLVPGQAPGPEAAAIAADQRDRLRSLVAGLPADQRHAIELRLAGLSGPEVAAAMGRSHRSVKMLQFRAIERLRLLIGAGHANPGIDDD